MPIENVVADANVLLSAVIGKAALRVFTEFEIRVHAATFNADEVREYIPELAAKYRLQPELVQLQWALLPLRLHAFEVYRHLYEEAVADLAHRDPEDAHPLALARHLGTPLWSNDRHLAGLGVECFSTARLLATLEKSKGRPR